MLFFFIELEELGIFQHPLFPMIDEEILVSDCIYLEMQTNNA